MGQRIAFRMKLKPGFENEYKKRHDEVWPELTQLLKDTGISEYSIFLDGETLNLFGFMKVEHNATLDDLPKQDVMKNWWAYMRDIMETNPDNSPSSVQLDEVFYLP